MTDILAASYESETAERILRFLDEDSSRRDELRLITSLSPMPYLRATTARAFGRHR